MIYVRAESESILLTEREFSQPWDEDTVWEETDAWDILGMLDATAIFMESAYQSVGIGIIESFTDSFTSYGTVTVSGDLLTDETSTDIFQGGSWLYTMDLESTENTDDSFTADLSAIATATFNHTETLRDTFTAQLNSHPIGTVLTYFTLIIVDPQDRFSAALNTPHNITYIPPINVIANVCNKNIPISITTQVTANIMETIQ